MNTPAGMASSLIHPMRYMRTRPFAKSAVQSYVRQTGRTLPTMQVLEAIQGTVINAFNQAISLLPRERRPERPMAMLSNEASLAMHVGMYAAFGRNVYALSPRLVELLDRTDLASVRTGDTRLPFGAFYVSFGGAFDACLPGPPNRIDGAYVSLSSPERLQITVTSRRLDVRTNGAARWPFSRDLYYYAPLDISDPDKTFEDVLLAALGTEIKLQPEITEPDPDMIADLPDGRQVLVQDVRDLTAAEEAEFAREGLPAFRRALALVVNALCYMTAEPQDGVVQYPDDVPEDLAEAAKSKKPSVRERAKAQLLDRGFSFIKVLGAGLAGLAGREVGDVGHGDGSVRPHWRRGHWRRQPYGPQRAETRLVWIYPTLVRADCGEPDSGHVYRLK